MPIYVPEENLPHLQEWLTGVLDPLTPADPATLAEYVITLLKHDKSGSDLMKHCVDQLYDFLKENTESFVAKLFRTIQGCCYISYELLFFSEILFLLPFSFRRR